jgi:hypothetical protein
MEEELVFFEKERGTNGRHNERRGREVRKKKDSSIKY